MLDLRGIKHYVHDSAQFASFLLLLLLLASQAKNKLFFCIMSSIYTRVAALAIAICSLGCLAAAVLCYILYPNYFDHFEAVTAAISARAFAGATPYPNVLVGDIYEAPYGPLLFLVDGAFIKASPTIAGSKLPGVLCFAAAMGIMSCELWRVSKDLMGTIMLAGFSAALFMYMREDGTYVYWDRSEPFLLLMASVALAVCNQPGKFGSAFILGVLAGCASGFKLHGALYLLPAAVGVVGGAPTFPRRLALAAVISATAGVVVLAPFAGHGGLGRLKGYFEVISMTSRHGMLPTLFAGNILLSLTLLVPSAFLLFMGARASAQTTWMFVGLTASLLLAAVIGSKAGAGVHHLLPLVPMALYVYAKLEAESSVPVSHAAFAGISAVLVSMLYPYFYVGVKGVATDANRLSVVSREYQKLAELAALSDRYPAAEVGLSDQDRFADSFYKALPVMRGRPYVIDFSSWADFKQAGYGDERLVSLVSSCHPRAWILPKGPPFTVASPFSDELLLTDAFRRAFYASYRKVEERRYFDAWVCRRR